MDKFRRLTGKDLLTAAGCSILADSNTTPAVKKVIEEKGWPLDKPCLIGPPSDSVVRPAMYVVHNELHTQGKVAMFPIDFMKDLGTDWYSTLTGGKKEVPCMIYAGFVVGESIPMLKVLATLFPRKALSAREEEVIERTLACKANSDHLLKHFGFCKMAEGAKPYRYKGALQGEGLAWVKGELKPVTECFDQCEEILKGGSEFLGGSEFGAADCAFVATIGSLYHITEAPIDKNYPILWRYYEKVKKMYVERSDWEEISKTGCGFFKAFEQFEMFVKVFNCERRFFACCSGREALSNPVYWADVQSAAVE